MPATYTNLLQLCSTQSNSNEQSVSGSTQAFIVTIGNDDNDNDHFLNQTNMSILIVCATLVIVSLLIAFAVCIYVKYAKQNK